jgi:hypothetical protein
LPLAGLGVRLFTDEMIHADLAPTLRRQGYDAESCQEARRSNQRIGDEAQLVYATQQGRAIFTCNAIHFLRLDHQWKAAGRAHRGIILTPQVQDLGLLLRLVARHLDTYPPGVQDDLLLWLSTSPLP